MIRNLVFKQWMTKAAQVTSVALALVIPLSNSATTALAILVLLFWILALDKTKLQQGFKHPISKAIFIFIALYVIGTVYTVASGTEIISALRKSTRLLYFPLLVPFFTQARWRTAAIMAFLAAMILSVAATYFTYNHNPFFKDNIFTSLFVAFSCFILAHFIVINKKSRFITIPLLLIFTYYLFFVSIGRVGQVLYMLLYALLCWQYLGRQFKKLLLAGVVLIMMLLAIVMLPSTFAKRHATAAHEVQSFLQDSNASVAESSMGLRLTFVQNGLQLFLQKPIFGWGTGSFAAAYQQQFPHSKENHTYTVNPHNQYVLVAVEFGILGLAALLFMFFTMAKVFWQNKDLSGYLGLGLVMSIAVGCLANSWLLDFASMYFFVLFLSVFAGDKIANARH